MLSIGKLTLGQQSYYVEQVAAGIEDYYAGSGEAAGRWLASSRELLGVEGDVDADVLHHVLKGLDPSGVAKLVGGRNRTVAGFDLTFSAPKSVSVVWALGDPGVNLAVSRAHDASVTAALSYLEANATFTRRGHGGVEVIPARGLVAAGFRHRTSRNGDPQLHTHVLVANMALGVDGKWSTLDGRHFYTHRLAAGYLYQTELRHQLTRTLGVKWSAVEKGAAEIDGVPVEVLAMFSTRRAEIEERMAISGVSGPAAAERAALETRRTKREVDGGTLFERWRDQAAQIGYTQDHVHEILGHYRPKDIDQTHARRIAAHLVGAEGLTANASTFTRADVVRSVANYVPTGMNAKTTETLAAAVLALPAIVPVGEPSAGRFSTRELVALETAAIDAATVGPGRAIGMCTARNLNGVLRREVTLGEDQRDMVRRITRSGNGVDLVVAPAGTGKTYAMSFAREVWRRRGYRVTGVALAGRAAAELEASAGIPSHTFAAFEKRMSRIPLTNRDVVVVDEAGMVGTRTLAPLLIAASHAKAKVVLMGDFHQLPEIEAGGLLRGLAERIDPIVLDENRRQREMWERVALVDLRDGDVTQAITTYAERGRIHIARDADTAKWAMVQRWAELEATGERVVMLAAKYRAVQDLNRLARAHITNHLTAHVPEIEMGGRMYRPSDRVVATRNDYKLGVRNGHTGTITHIDRQGVDVAFDHGPTIRLTDEYARQHLDRAYAITVHKAQGSTFNHALLFADSSLTRELGYVAMSRGRITNELHLAEPMTRDMAHGLEIAPAAALQALTATLQLERDDGMAIDR